MTTDDKINRRDFIVTTAGVAGTASALASPTPARAQTPSVPPLGFATQKPFAEFWEKQLRDVVQVDPPAIAPEQQERHRIYCCLLMALIQRFWNGNKKGPIGFYPGRADQKEADIDPTGNVFRYRGDKKTDDPLRVNWDRYVGHNIACLAVDKSGEIIDFEFNHNDLFRSSAEHAEARMVRRLFSLTDDFADWKESRLPSDKPIRTKSSRISLDHVTLYTSLESCAQCSGVMSLAAVKEVVYLQNDFGAYMIGNIMFNLGSPGTSPRPIAAKDLGVNEFQMLNNAYLDFKDKILKAETLSDQKGAFFVPPPGVADEPDFHPSITSFLCTDEAYKIFSQGAARLRSDTLVRSPNWSPNPNDSKVLNNNKCLEEARRFFQYADVEGFRASPHRP